MVPYKAEKLFPAAVILSIQIVRIDVDSGRKIVLCQKDSRFCLDPYLVPTCAV